MLRTLERWLMFRPISHRRAWLPPPNERVRDVWLQSGSGTAIHAWWYPLADDQRAPEAVLYCHGTGGNLSHRGDTITRWQQEMRQNVLIFDYPGYGRSAGKPSEIGCYAAADAAYDWLLLQGIAAEHILFYGGSLGGAVAIDLACRRRHRALVLVSTFTSIVDMAHKLYPWLPIKHLIHNRFDSLSKLTHCKQPVFIAHGTHDRLIPFAHAERLFEAANAPKQFFPMAGYDHQHTPGPSFYARLRQFLEQTMKL